MQLTAVLMHADEGSFVALNPETGTTTQGETAHEAVDNLREATTLYLEEFGLTPHCSRADRLFRPRSIPTSLAPIRLRHIRH